MLGEQLPSAAELMATDPAVAALRTSVSVAQGAWDSWLNTSQVRVRTHRDEDKYKNWTGRDIYDGGKWKGLTEYKYYREGSERTIRGRRFIDLGVYAKIGKGLLKGLQAAKRRLKESEKRVWDRIAQSLPYKAYVIKPIVNRSANTIVYQLTKDGKNVESPTQTLEQAKALVDKGIATTQQKEVDTWTEQRKSDIVAQSQAPQGKPAVQTANGQPQAPLYKNPLLIGGAAALAALVLIK